MKGVTSRRGRHASTKTIHQDSHWSRWIINSILSFGSWKMSVVFICHCICSICLSKKVEENGNKIIAYDKAEKKIRDLYVWSHVTDSYWSCELGSVFQENGGKKVERNGLNSFLYYPMFLNTFQMFYPGVFLRFQIWRGYPCCLLNFLAWDSERWGSHEMNIFYILS